MMPHFQSPVMLLLLLFIPAAIALFVHGEKRRRDALRTFSGIRGEDQGRLFDRRAGFVCFSLAAVCLILALARPAWRQIPEDVSSEGRDVVFLLDVSRSMLAGDLNPDRLETARRAIRDCVAQLDGDRVGLVAFAGSSSILCPLTTDYEFFYEQLEEAHPEIVDQGGTRIGDALRKTADKLLSSDRKGLQDVILVSDGGDQESRPENAASELEEVGAHFVVIGIGDARQGARIPSREADGPTWTMHDGKEVWSRLEANSLEALARATRNGVFLNAGTQVLPLGEIYPELVKHFRRDGVGDNETMMRWEETFPGFLAAALVFLVTPLLLGRKKVPVNPSATAILMGLLVFGGFSEQAQAESATALYETGEERFKARNFLGAVESFMLAAEKLRKEENRAAAIFNAGNGAFLQAEADEALDPQSSLVYYQQAIRAYRTALQMNPDLDGATWNLELALHRLRDIETELDSQDQQPPTDEEGEEQQSSDQEGESESDSEDYEDDWEESQEGATEPSDQSQGPNSMNMESQDIPPPMVDPEDIFQQEAANNEVREKTSGSKYKPVEKDW